ncbi:MAG TPA: FAD-dependent oxidoreductase [Solirubrobacterales bacterium]|jgi:succinate dehydrogenase/fumarate reductase flavoprotein subunit|nr:FAD-dependent oxidoreductase [Solirubrobacterales bacterium]
MNDSGGTVVDRRAEAEGSRVSRRSLLVAAGVAAGGATVGSRWLAPGIAKAAGQKFDATADVIVVGGGGAGFAAATSAVLSGASVMLIEKAPVVGGTTAKSGGEYWIPNNPEMAKRGWKDPKDWAMKYMVRLSYPGLYDADSPTLGVEKDRYELIDTFYDNGSKIVEELSAKGALKSQIQPTMGFSENPIADPDYHADLPEDHAPYGRGLNPSGSLAGGSGLVSQLAAFARAKGVKVLTAQRVVGLATNGKREVVGVEVEDAGKARLYRAKKGVIFGSGGFTQDRNKALHYLKGPIFGGCAVLTNTGDFIDIASQLGARLGNLSNAFNVQNVLEQSLTSTSVTTEAWIPYGDSMVIVNRYGKRVAPEKMVYNERTQTHYHWDPQHCEYTNIVQFMIYDGGVAENPEEFGFRSPVPLPGQQASYVIKADTFPELAKKIQERLARFDNMASITGAITPKVRLDSSFAGALEDTIKRFNSYAETGKDLEFERGTKPIEVAWNGAGRKGNTKNPTMYPFRSKGPYYCIILGGGTLDTNGGPVINTKGQVLHIDGTPIPGLYGAGNCIASPAGQAYWSGGGTIAPGLVYGYLGGQNAAKEPVKEV